MNIYIGVLTALVIVSLIRQQNLHKEQEMIKMLLTKSLLEADFVKEARKKFKSLSENRKRSEVSADKPKRKQGRPRKAS